MFFALFPSLHSLSDVLPRRSPHLNMVREVQMVVNPLTLAAPQIQVVKLQVKVAAPEALPLTLVELAEELFQIWFLKVVWKLESVSLD